VRTTVRVLLLAYRLFVVFLLVRVDLWAAEKSAKPLPVRIGYVSRSILDMPYMIARDRGLFREEGLQPELIFVKAGLTPQVLLAGGIDFGTATGTGISAAVSGADLRLIYALTDRPSFDLISLPSITNIQQLRGKKLGVSGVGSLAEILTRQILIANHVPPEQVTLGVGREPLPWRRQPVRVGGQEMALRWRAGPISARTGLSHRRPPCPSRRPRPCAARAVLS